MEKRLSQVTGEKASPFSFSQPGTVPFPRSEFLLWPTSPALYALNHSLKQQQREADSSTSTATSAGVGKTQERAESGREAFTSSLPKGPREGQKAHSCCLKTALVVLFLLKVLRLTFLWLLSVYFFLNTEFQCQFKNFCECWGRGREARTSLVFSFLAFWSAPVFQKGTKEKPHWDHNKSSVVLEEMRAYNLDEMRSGRHSTLKNPATAEWQNTLVPQKQSL